MNSSPSSSACGERALKKASASSTRIPWQSKSGTSSPRYGLFTPCAWRCGRQLGRIRRGKRPSRVSAVRARGFPPARHRVADARLGEGTIGRQAWLFTFARNRRACAFSEHHRFIAIERGFEPVWGLADIKYEWSRSQQRTASGLP